jgi:hypothetical protein
LWGYVAAGRVNYWAAYISPLLTEIYRTGRALDDEGDPVDPFPSSVRNDLRIILLDLLLQRNLFTTLEFGVAYGP